MSFAALRYPQVAGKPVAMAILTSALVVKGQVDDAVRLGIEAVEAAPLDIRVRDMVAAALGRSLPTWHIPMLRDGPRNECYKAALERAIRPGMRVLEIGTGAGFLSMVAARAGALVVTCEMDPVVAALAGVIAERNGLADRIRVVSKPSSALEIGTDMPEKAELLMSELFDDTLIGDNVIGAVADAKRRLLVDGAVIVPARAELRCALVEIPPLGKDAPLGLVDGFDMSPLNGVTPRLATHLRVGKKRTTLRSDVLPALALDFHYDDFAGVTKAELAFDSRGGAVNGVAQWLRIDFGGGSIYDNDPFAEGDAPHWGAPVTPFASAMTTEPGDVVRVSVLRIGRELFYDVPA